LPIPPIDQSGRGTAQVCDAGRRDPRQRHTVLGWPRGSSRARPSIRPDPESSCR
jgi:hypothetical protein